MKRLVFLLVSSLFWCATYAFALNVTPSRYELSIKPGSGHKGVYTVTNDTNETITVAVSIKDWFIAPENKQFTCDTWLKVPAKQFTLKPKASRKIKFKVKAPRKAEGALFAMISLTSKAEGVEVLSVVISVPVFVVLKGTEKYDGEIKNVKYTADEDNFQVSAEIHNTGNVHLRPKGSCVLKSADKGNVEIQIPEGRPVYPGASRVSLGRIPKNSVPGGSYNAALTILAGDLIFNSTAQVQINGDKTLLAE